MPETKARRRWLKVVVALVMMGALVAWFIPWADRRMNTMPLSVEQAYARYGPIRMPTPDDEATQQLVDTCDSLLPLPSIDDSLPPGMEWRDGFAGRSIVIGEVNSGPWTPETRSNLRACISYLKSSQTDTALNDLARVRGKHWRQRFVVDFMNDYARLSIEDTDIRRLVKTLVARARCRYEERHDIERAWDDLKTGLWLADSVEHDCLVSVSAGMCNEKSVLVELNHLIREADIPMSLARDIRAIVDGRVNLVSHLPGIIQGERAVVYSMLASRYADLPDGDGWLVLSNTHFVKMLGFDNTNGSRSHRFWNLATIFHNRFKTVRSKMDLIYENLGKAVSMNYVEGRAHIRDWTFRSRLDWRDGPASSVPDYLDWFEEAYVFTHRSMALRNAVIVNLALNILQQKDGHYPETLPTKIEGWFGELPVDPFSNESFGYRCEDGQNYTLWSVGLNGVDNNGATQRGVGSNGTRSISIAEILSDNETDILFSLDREKSRFDPVAIPVNSTNSADTNGVEL